MHVTNGRLVLGPCVSSGASNNLDISCSTHPYQRLDVSYADLLWTPPSPHKIMMIGNCLISLKIADHKDCHLGNKK
jgi:hypothetical protein